MWSLLLYLLIAAGQPVNTQSEAENPDHSQESNVDTRRGDGGDKGTPVPPRPPKS